MSWEPVDVFVLRSLDEQPLEGVLVKIYDPTGATFYTQGITDADGKVSFLLETLSYTMRFYKLHTGFSQPQYFDVQAAPAVNVFDVIAESFVYPTPTNPRLCRCSGFFLDATGAPRSSLAIHFTPAFDCFLLDDDAVPIDSFKRFTDSDGFICVDLIRGAEYLVYLESLQGEAVKIQIPDQASANLPDVLMTVIGSVILSPDGPYALSVGGTLDITPTVLLRSGVPRDGVAVADVQWSVEDNSIASVTVSSDILTIRGISAGTTRLLAERTSTSAVRIPDEPIEGVPVDIVVS